MSIDFGRFIATEWTVLTGFVITILMGFFSARASYRLARPSKAVFIHIEMKRKGRLSHTDSEDFPTLNYDPQRYDPERYYFRLSVSNVGRQPIKTSDFEQGMPLEIDLGARVLHLENPVSENRSQRSPAVDLHPGLPSVLRFGPGLLNVDQKVLIHVVAQGEAFLQPQGALIDVDIRTTKYGRVAQRNAKPVVLGAWLTALYIYSRYVLHTSLWDSMKFWKHYSPLSNIHSLVDAWKSTPLAVIAIVALGILIGACFEVID